MKQVVRTGWGRTISVNSIDLQFGINTAFIREGVGQHGLAVGLGRSYGDSSLNVRGVTWTSRLLKFMDFDLSNDEVLCGAGVTIGELERESVSHGLFPRVVPGTEFVTIGGAVASNIHGKSHHTFGAFADQIIEMTIANAVGEMIVLRPSGKNSEYFWATVGGMGLTGAVVSVRIKLSRISSAFISVKEERVKSLSQMLELLKFYDKHYLYTVAWIDLSGRFEGRGIVSGGNHTPLSDLKPRERTHPFQVKHPGKILLPDIFPSFTINKYSVGFFNQIWYQKPISKTPLHYRNFLHPLDSIRLWNRIYGKNGFVQYQVLVPFGKEMILEELLNELRKLQAGSFLGVLKRFDGKRQRYLSFPDSGWTLAIDLPARLPGIYDFFNKFDLRLAQEGGKIYLTKDSRMSQEIFEKMYPEHNSWKAIQRDMDPQRYWKSLQGERLGLV
jgi:decaprenylphospho-beta-D-ribofuranose 2-oxidase